MSNNADNKIKFCSADSEDGLALLNAKFNVQLYRECIAFYSKHTGSCIPCIVPFCLEEDEINIPQLLIQFYGRVGFVTVDELLQSYREYGITAIRDVRALSYATSVAYRYLTKETCRKESLVAFLKSIQSLEKDVMLLSPLVKIAAVNGKEQIVLEKMVYLEYKSLLEFLFVAHEHAEDKAFLAFCLLKGNLLLDLLKMSSRISMQQNYKMYKWFAVRLAGLDEEMIKEKSLYKLFNLFRGLVFRTITKKRLDLFESYGIGAADACYLYYKLIDTKVDLLGAKQSAKWKSLVLITGTLANSKLYHEVVEDLVYGKADIEYNYDRLKLLESIQKEAPSLGCDYEWLYGLAQKSFGRAGLSPILMFVCNKDTYKRFAYMTGRDQVSCLNYTIMKATDDKQKQRVADFFLGRFGKEFFMELAQKVQIPVSLFDFLLEYSVMDLDSNLIKEICPDTVISEVMESTSRKRMQVLEMLLRTVNLHTLHARYSSIFSKRYWYRSNTEALPTTELVLDYSVIGKDGLRSLLSTLLEYKIRYELHSVPSLLEGILKDSVLSGCCTENELEGIKKIIEGE